jgi:hypothetical protein
MTDGKNILNKNILNENILSENDKARITIYSGTFDEHIGTITSKLTDRIISNINKYFKKINGYNKTVHVYRKYELHNFGSYYDSQNIKVISPSTVKCNIYKNIMLSVEKIQEKNILSFPILSKYHNTIVENIVEYQDNFGNNILIIKDDSNICYFRLEVNNFNITKINNLLATIMKEVSLQ